MQQPSHEQYRHAIYDCIVKKDYTEIDQMVADFDIGGLIQIKHSRTPIFCAVERVLGVNAHIEEADRAHVIDIVVEGLKHILSKVDQKLASDGKSDKELLNGFVKASCNHISHTSLLPSGGTVRDLLEEYCDVDVTRKPDDKAYDDLYMLVKEYRLKQTQELAVERLRKTKLKGREL